jgi:hypothetical protein
MTRREATERASSMRGSYYFHIIERPFLTHITAEFRDVPRPFAGMGCPVMAEHRWGWVFGIASNGFFVFSQFPYSDAFASFLSGHPVFFLQGGGNPDRHIGGKAS